MLTRKTFNALQPQQRVVVRSDRVYTVDRNEASGMSDDEGSREVCLRHPAGHYVICFFVKDRGVVEDTGFEDTDLNDETAYVAE